MPATPPVSLLSSNTSTTPSPTPPISSLRRCDA
jgi:hypothetical protein